MRCERANRVLLLDSVRWAPDEARTLEDHAASCAECSAVLRRVRAVRVVLAKDVVEVPPGARAAMRRRLEKPRSLPVLVPALAGALAAAAIAFLLVRAPDVEAPERERARPPPQAREAPERERVRVPPHARVKLARGEDGRAVVLGLDGRVVTHDLIGHASAGPAGAVLELAAGELETTLFLESGALAFELEPLAPGETFEVHTTDARIHVLATRFTVDTSKETEVDVAAGRVSMWRQGATVPIFVDERAPERAPPAKPADAERARTLEAARAALPHDAPRAAELAQTVLDQGARGELEAAALAVLADAARRRGLLREAERTYAKVRDHVRGEAYAEEAMLQRALLLAELGEPAAALDELGRLESAFAAGATVPERASLAARLHLERGDVAAAADVITRARYDGTSLLLERRRLEVARLLVERDPRRTLELLRRALEHGAPSSMEEELRALRTRAEARLEQKE